MPKKQKFSEAEDNALWWFRREIGIADNDIDGWKLMAHALVRQKFPDAMVLSSRQGMVMALMGHPDERKKRGPRIKWTPEFRTSLLDQLDQIKAESNRPETDESAIQVLLEKDFKGRGIKLKALKNQAAISRQMAKEGKLPPY